MRRERLSILKTALPWLQHAHVYALTKAIARAADEPFTALANGAVRVIGSVAPIESPHNLCDRDLLLHPVGRVVPVAADCALLIAVSMSMQIPQIRTRVQAGYRSARWPGGDYSADIRRIVWTASSRGRYPTRQSSAPNGRSCAGATVYKNPIGRTLVTRHGQRWGTPAAGTALRAGQGHGGHSEQLRVAYSISFYELIARR
jgi:hypothetical protein